MFDPDAVLEQIREKKHRQRQRGYTPRKSRLDPHTSEILKLHDSGARVSEIRTWLSEPPRKIVVAHTTITRWLTKMLQTRQERGIS